MSGGTFAKCVECGRMLIYGQTCVCDETEPRRCDCTYTDNKQHIGPNCARRIRDDWTAAIRHSRKTARSLDPTAEETDQ